MLQPFLLGAQPVRSMAASCSTPGCRVLLVDSNHRRCCSTCQYGRHTKRCLAVQRGDGYKKCRRCGRQAGPGYRVCCGLCREGLHSPGCDQRQAAVSSPKALDLNGMD